LFTHKPLKAEPSAEVPPPELVIADPAGNITALVSGRVEDRAALAHRIMADKALKAEQVGFVTEPDGEARKLWRLEMSGGEFCGNAARSFGLYAAGLSGLSGKHTVSVEISGMKGSIPVRVDTETGAAEVEIPGPVAENVIEYEGRSLPVIVFDGITHVIAPGFKSDEKMFYRVKEIIEAEGEAPEALGLLFWDEERLQMIPLVYVYAAGTLVFESSCGSGSAALGVWLSRNAADSGRGQAEHCFSLRQPGGTIETRVSMEHGRVRSVSIGGKVTLSRAVRFTL
jgi:diaminopimelate epimerase